MTRGIWAGEIVMKEVNVSLNTASDGDNTISAGS